MESPDIINSFPGVYGLFVPIEDKTELQKDEFEKE